MAPCNHAKLAPSSSARWLRCHASAYWSARLPAGAASAYAQEGTWAHLLAERMLTGAEGSWFTSSEVSDIVKAGFDPESFKLPVSLYVDYVRAIPGTLMTEHALFIGPVTGEDGATGTADAVIIDGDTLHICDLKYGAGVKVSAENNSQLLIYAGATISEFDWLYEFKKICLHIIQPRLDNISKWELSRADFDALINEIKFSAARCFTVMTDPEVPSSDEYAPGEIACRWCPFKAKCGALARFSLTLAGLELRSTLKPALDGSAVSEILKNSDLIKNWLESVAELACGALLSGEKIPGYKVVTGRPGNREWTDADAAEKMLKGWKVPAEARYVKKLITPTAAEKLLKMKTITDDQWAELSALVYRAPGKPTLALESDKRPAITSKPSAEDYPDENKK